VILSQGTTEEVVTFRDDAGQVVVPNDCSHSSKSWAQEYLYLVHRLGGRDAAAVGFASDQSLLAWVGPRYGPRACAGRGSEMRRQLAKPATATSCLARWVPTADGPPTAGKRVVDFDTEGFAHIGLLREFLEDLCSDGLTADDIAPLFRSAEAYVSMWERAELAAARMTTR
jgi:hypothetical protein